MIVKAANLIGFSTMVMPIRRPCANKSIHLRGENLHISDTIHALFTPGLRAAGQHCERKLSKTTIDRILREHLLWSARIFLCIVSVDVHNRLFCMKDIEVVANFQLLARDSITLSYCHKVVNGNFTECDECECFFI